MNIRTSYMTVSERQTIELMQWVTHKVRERRAMLSSKNVYYSTHDG